MKKRVGATRIVNLYNEIDKMVEKSLGRPYKEIYQLKDSIFLILPTIIVLTVMNYALYPENFDWVQTLLAAVKTFAITHFTFYFWDLFFRQLMYLAVQKSKKDFKNILINQAFDVLMVNLEAAEHQSKKWLQNLNPYHALRTAQDDKDRAYQLEYYHHPEKQLRGYIIKLPTQHPLNIFYPSHAFLEQEDFKEFLEKSSKLVA
jgi:hypothetical protein